jgi:hypothetical protein
LLPCSEAADAGQAAEVDDHIIDYGEQHATWSTWSAASVLPLGMCWQLQDVHLTIT